MKWYVVKYLPKRATVWTEFHRPPDGPLGPAPRCPVCGGVTGFLTELPPYRYELETFGRGFGDMAFGAGGDVIVSSNFKDAWERDGLTGIVSFSPVEIFKVTRHRKFAGDPPDYFLLNIVRSRTAVDEVASRFVRRGGPPCAECRQGRDLVGNYGVFFEQDTIEPYDLFYARGLSGLMASERFKAWAERGAFTNVNLVPCEKYMVSYFHPRRDDPDYEKNLRESGLKDPDARNESAPLN